MHLQPMRQILLWGALDIDQTVQYSVLLVKGGGIGPFHVVEGPIQQRQATPLRQYLLTSSSLSMASRMRSNNAKPFPYVNIFSAQLVDEGGR